MYWLEKILTKQFFFNSIDANCSFLVSSWSKYFDKKIVGGRGGGYQLVPNNVKKKRSNAKFQIHQF